MNRSKNDEFPLASANKRSKACPSDKAGSGMRAKVQRCGSVTQGPVTPQCRDGNRNGQLAHKSAGNNFAAESSRFVIVESLQIILLQSNLSNSNLKGMTVSFQ